MTGASGTAVLICTRDRSALLEGCLDAVLRCDPAPAEVIVVDQSAGGASREAVARRRGRGAPVRYVRGAGAGLSRARNQGIAECAAAILAFTDDDCLVDRGWLAALTGPIRTGRADAVVGRTLPEEGGSGGETTFSYYAPARVPVFTRRTHPWRLGGGGNFAAARAALLQAGPFDERFGPGAPLESAEDMDMIHRLLRGGARIVHAPQAVVWHRSWRSPEQNRRLARAYGIGAGGYFAKHFLAGDLISGWRFVARAGIRAVHLARALAARDRREMAGQAAYLSGLFAGAGRYARRAGSPATAAAEPERGAA
jgi:glycosyltransferase involved in cell wall biosynthesis